MSFSVVLSDSIKQELSQIWALSTEAEILEMTAFGDLFVRLGETYKLYSLTDGTVADVTSEINEYGLPPVSFELGDEWYQLDAQAALKEEGKTLEEGQCFGFDTPLYQDGEYSLDNISVKEILAYHRSSKESIR